MDWKTIINDERRKNEYFGTLIVERGGGKWYHIDHNYNHVIGKLKIDIKKQLIKPILIN